MGRGATLLCIIPGHQPWFRAIPLSLSLLAGVKKGHDLEQEEQDQVLPLPCYWQLSLCDLPIFNIAPGQAWLPVSVERRLSGRDGVMLDLAM